MVNNLAIFTDNVHLHFFRNEYTVKPVYNGQSRGPEKCPLRAVSLLYMDSNYIHFING